MSKDDASGAEHHLVERSSRDQKFHSHILMQREALFWSKQYDRLFLHRESPKALCCWNRHPTNTITFYGSFCLCLVPPFLLASSRSLAHTRSFWEFSTPSMSTKFLIWKENSHLFFFSKNLFEPNLQIFFVWSSVHWKAMLRLLSYKNVALNRFSLFLEHFSRKFEGPSIVFELILFSLGVNGVLPFEYCLSFLGNVDHLVDLTIWSSQTNVSFVNTIWLLLSQFDDLNVDVFLLSCDHCDILKVRPFENLYFSLFKNSNMLWISEWSEQFCRAWDGEYFKKKFSPIGWEMREMSLKYWESHLSCRTRYFSCCLLLSYK